MLILHALAYIPTRKVQWQTSGDLQQKSFVDSLNYERSHRSARHHCRVTAMAEKSTFSPASWRTKQLCPQTWDALGFPRFQQGMMRPYYDASSFVGHLEIIATPFGALPTDMPLYSRYATTFTRCITCFHYFYCFATSLIRPQCCRVLSDAQHLFACVLQSI